MNTTTFRDEPGIAHGFASLRRRWAAGLRCRSDTAFAFGVSLLWLAIYNVRFWQDSVQAMWHGTIGSAVFFASLFLVVWCLQALLLLLMPTRRAMRGAASALFVVAAVGTYFATKYGVVMNKDMLRNVFETDAQESLALLSGELFVQVLLLGALPALLVWKIRLPVMRASTRLRKRSVAILSLLALCAVALLGCSASYAVFFREHKPIRFTLVPVAPLTSAIGVAFDKNKGERGPLINASGVAQRTASPRPKPLVVVMVVGETARAADFELGGYGRHTNPELAALDDLVYFPHATSCGTATALSVPCMFSHLPRREFDVDEAPRYANVLDALQSTGVHVEWRDNNAGCKGVCARVASVASCRESSCYDEVMLDGFAGKLDTLQADTVIVMHQIGSHGPAYSQRYPPEFEKFRPACHSNQLQRCSAQEVVNAYDNTIVYTDHVLARTIDMLRQASNTVDGMLMYVSDHGESLGEQGMYLHGMPYAFAPDTQRHVPMLLWLSPAYAARQGIDVQCLESHAGEPRSHDNVYHTLLGAAEVRNDSYDAKLDLLAECRKLHLSGDHE